MSVFTAILTHISSITVVLIENAECPGLPNTKKALMIRQCGMNMIAAELISVINMTVAVAELMPCFTTTEKAFLIYSTVCSIPH
jgi:hypothetical protein